MGKGSPNLCTPCPKPSDVALGRCWGHLAKTFRSVELLLSGLGWGLRGTESSPGSCPPSDIPRTVVFVFRVSLCVRWAALSWLCSQLHPLMSVGLRWWNQEKNLAPCLFIPPPSPLFFGLLSLTPARLVPSCRCCWGESSCCLAQLRCFVSNLGSEHICSAFCFLPPSSLAVKHFIIQTLWKALYKMKL